MEFDHHFSESELRCGSCVCACCLIRTWCDPDADAEGEPAAKENFVISSPTLQSSSSSTSEEEEEDEETDKAKGRQGASRLIRKRARRGRGEGVRTEAGSAVLLFDRDVAQDDQDDEVFISYGDNRVELCFHSRHNVVHVACVLSVSCNSNDWCSSGPAFHFLGCALQQSSRKLRARGKNAMC